ncbi:MAG: 6-pyruvoyl tetrahydropterin synthase family protein [Phycisphaerales bacterium JB040]
MHAITVESEFSAAHALSIAGIREPLHGHDWHVTATIEGPTLDSDGLLADFHTIHDALAAITGEYHNSNLHDHADYAEANPSAEVVAETIAVRLAEAIGEGLAEHARLARVTVSEAPRCTATFTPGG